MFLWCNVICCCEDYLCCLCVEPFVWRQFSTPLGIDNKAFETEIENGIVFISLKNTPKIWTGPLYSVWNLSKAANWLSAQLGFNSNYIISQSVLHWKNFATNLVTKLKLILALNIHSIPCFNNHYWQKLIKNTCSY